MTSNSNSDNQDFGAQKQQPASQKYSYGHAYGETPHDPYGKQTQSYNASSYSSDYGYAGPSGYANYQTDTDREHLNLLSIFYFVISGLTALGSLFPFIHLAIGIVILSSGEPAKAPVEIGWFFVGIAGFLILSGFLMTMVLVMTGLNLRKQRNRIFCLVVAGIQCLMFPLGTALGLFTIVVLSRPSVIAKFEKSAY